MKPINIGMSAKTFSIDSDKYAQSRPRYPGSLFEWLAKRSHSNHKAWDCATGSGQGAIGLSDFFDKVYATDISGEQIENAVKNEKIIYSVNSVEHSNFDNNSFDLIVAAQSLHWFEYSEYWMEVKRVAKPGALFSAWGYDWAYSTPQVDDLLIKPFKEILLPFWNKKNAILWRGYKNEDIHFPFKRIPMPNFEIYEEWPIQNLINYFQTWSAFKLADDNALEQLNGITKNILNKIEPTQIIPIRMPLKSFAGIIK